MAFPSRDPDLIYRQLRLALAHPDPWGHATAGWVQSMVLTDRGDTEGADRAQAAGGGGFRAIGDRWGIVMALDIEASSRSLRGDHAGAIAALEEAFALASQFGAEEGRLLQLWQLSLEHMRAGDAESAWHHLHTARGIAERSGNVQLEMMVHFGTVDIARRSGDVQPARENLELLATNTYRAPVPPEVAAFVSDMSFPSRLRSDTPAA